MLCGVWGVERPVLSIVIPTHDRSSILRQTLDRLRGTAVPVPYEVIVVANACTDDTEAVVVGQVARGLPAKIIIDPRPSASTARNVGARHAAGDLLVFLDDDILVHPDSLRILAEWFRDHPDEIVVTQIVPLPQHVATAFGGFRNRCVPLVPPSTPPTPVDWFASGLAGVPALVFEELSGYAEDYAAAGLEDADFAIRARRSAQKITFHPAIIAEHNDWAGTTAVDYCRRAAAHSATAPLLAQAFPDNDHPWRAAVETNRPVQLDDAATLRLKKRVKELFIGLGADRWLPRAADRLPAPRIIRDLLYRTSISLNLYAGYQRGITSRP